MKEIVKTLADFPMPDSTAIEKQVLGDIIFTPSLIGDIISLVNGSMFTSPIRKDMWNCITQMFQLGKKIDFVTIGTSFGKKAIEEIDKSYLTLGSSSASIIDHALTLRDAYAKRKAYLSALSLLESACNNTSTEISLVGETSAILDTMKEGAKDDDSLLSDIVKEIADDIESREKLSEEGKRWRIPTGFPTLDSLTFNGWDAGQLIILAARPSVGKTSVMLHMAKAAASSGFPAMICSLEMTNKELGRKLLYSTDIVSPYEVMSGKINWLNFEDAAKRITSLPITLNDSAKTLSQLSAKITLAAKKGVKIAFIDYLSLISDGDESQMTIYQLVTKITKNLKVTAKRAGIPVVLLCQLNRDMSKEGRAPQLFDLKDSGSIEQDADVVLMLEAPKSSIVEYNTTPEINMWVRKNRQFRKEVCIILQPNSSYSSFYETGTRES